jgi:hypothetical protein
VSEISRFFGLIISMYHNEHNPHTFTQNITNSSRSKIACSKKEKNRLNTEKSAILLN